MNKEQVDEECDRLRKAMAFKYGRKMAELAGEMVGEIATVIAIKSEIHNVKPMRLFRCTSDTMAGMISGVDRHSAEEIQENERN